MHSIEVNFPLRYAGASGIIAYQHHLRGLIADGDHLNVSDRFATPLRRVHLHGLPLPSISHRGRKNLDSPIFLPCTSCLASS